MCQEIILCNFGGGN